MYVHIGEVLRYLRLEQGLTQGQLADFVDVERKTIGSIERTGQGRIENIEKCLGWLGYELEIVPTNGKEKGVRINGRT